MRASMAATNVPQSSVRSTRQTPGSPRDAAAHNAFPYRMRDLCAASGLDRQTVHFYILQGLLPEGEKTGRNMAYYSEAHLQRLATIKRLQHERMLPLKAIKAVLDGELDTFSQEQRALLEGVRLVMEGDPVTTPSSQWVTLAAALSTAGVSQDDAGEFATLGLINMVERDGVRSIPAEDVAILEVWGKLRAAGFDAALGFEVRDLAPIEAAVSQIFAHEVAMITGRADTLEPSRVATLIRVGLPLINQLMARYHQAKARHFFSAMT